MTSKAFWAHLRRNGWVRRRSLGEHYQGRNGVRRFYDQLMKALPNLEIEVSGGTSRTRPFDGSDDSRHGPGARGGLPPTGRRVEFPLCGVFTFTPTTGWPARDFTTTAERC